MKVFQIAAGLNSYRSLADGTLRLSFETSELSPETMANIHYSLNKVGYLAYAPDPFATAELEEIDKLKVEFTDTGKPPSQRLRAVFYRLYEVDREGYKAFNDYYTAKMEQLIEFYKTKLP